MRRSFPCLLRWYLIVSRKGTSLAKSRQHWLVQQNERLL